MTEEDRKYLKRFGEKLKETRLENKLSQEKLADLANLDRTYISGLERGLKNPTFLVLKKFAVILKTDPNNFFL